MRYDLPVVRAQFSCTLKLHILRDGSVLCALIADDGTVVETYAAQNWNVNPLGHCIKGMIQEAKMYEDNPNHYLKRAA